MDHVLPESLLSDDIKRKAIFGEYGLPEDFNINSYENWLPCHNHCNQSKGSKLLTFVPGNKAILDSLKSNSKKAKRIELSVTSDVAKDKVFKAIFAGLEHQTITVRDLDVLIQAFIDDPIKAGVPDDVIILESGYWIPRQEIKSEGICQCERDACVGYNDKVYCYFQRSLSPWVVKTGLFWKCYDEIVSCPRCLRQHKRGHIGRNDICGIPYKNQETQQG